MAFNLQDYFLDHAIRLQRNTWGGGSTQMLSQEIFAMLSGIQRSIEQVTTTDEHGDPYVVPQINYPQVDLTPFDLDFPASPALDPPTITTPPPQTPVDSPEHQPPPQEQPQTSTQSVTQRNCFPGQVREDGLIAVYKDGLSRPPEVVSGVLIDQSQANAIMADQWVIVWMVARYLVAVTVSYTTSTGDVQADDVVYLFLPMGGGGGGLAITTSDIAGRETPSDPRSEIGTGQGILRVLIEGEWSDGESVTLYNSTSTSVDANKLVQWKMISGLRFVDVEDCGA